MYDDFTEKMKFNWLQRRKNFAEALLEEMEYDRDCIREVADTCLLASNRSRKPILIFNFGVDSIYDGTPRNYSSIEGLIEESGVKFGLLLREDAIYAYAFGLSKRPVVVFNFEKNFDELFLFFDGMHVEARYEQFRSLLGMEDRIREWFLKQQTDPNESFLNYLCKELDITDLSDDMKRIGLKNAIQDVCEFGDYISSLGNVL